MIWFFLFVLFWLPTNALAVIAIVDKAVVQEDNPSTTSTVTNQTVSGSDTLLLCAASMRNSSDVAATSMAWDPPGVNQAMTALSHVGSAGFTYTRLFYLANPTAGTNKTVVVTWAFDAGTGVVVQCVSFSGVDQATPVQNEATDSTDPTSVAVTSATGDLVWAINSPRGDCTEPAMGTGETDESGAGNYTNTNAAPDDRIWGKFISEPGAGSVTIDTTVGGGCGDDVMVGVSIKAAAAGGVAGPLRRRVQ